MRYSAPYTLALMIYADYPQCYLGTARRAAALGMSTQAIHAALQAHEHAVGIHHAYSTNVYAVGRIAFKRLHIWVLGCLLDRGRNFYIITVGSVEFEIS